MVRFSLWCILAATCTAATSTPPLPQTIGILALPKFVGLDAYGPIELLNLAAFSSNLSLSIIGQTLDLVSSSVGNTSGLIPSYTFDQDPKIDVLIIPGGPASRLAINNPEVIAYVKRTYPKLQYIMSICTGAQVLARAGVLDGKRATTNKFSWKEMVASGPTVNWVAHARWVIDNNIWTSSGVTAGMDMIHHFITTALRNGTLADRAANILEYEVHRDPSFDPFADIWGATDAPAVM
ncbi:class I glutamine amidotransferase-like protein [Collybia nuda]|uniref:Class I glutamine amidotransferase-like protein n=1 Tax=Collybia nuda TaxID=64659 RepID=A0A9P6C970_9AGAR|nr:class I glutamine amidotransferase-like protein [Collybia nuda]